MIIYNNNIVKDFPLAQIGNKKKTKKTQIDVLQRVAAFAH